MVEEGFHENRGTNPRLCIRPMVTECLREGQGSVFCSCCAYNTQQIQQQRRREKEEEENPANMKGEDARVILDVG